MSAQGDSIEAKVDLILAELVLVRSDMSSLTRHMRRIDKRNAKLRQEHLPKLKRSVDWLGRHDYRAGWNGVAGMKGLPKVSRLTTQRVAALKVAEADESFDWSVILNEVRVISKGFVEGFKGFGFDWIIGDPHNWTRVIEGKYRERGAPTHKEGMEDFFDG